MLYRRGGGLNPGGAPGKPGGAKPAPPGKPGGGAKPPGKPGGGAVAILAWIVVCRSTIGTYHRGHQGSQESLEGEHLRRGQVQVPIKWLACNVTVSGRDCHTANEGAGAPRPAGFATPGPALRAEAMPPGALFPRRALGSAGGGDSTDSETIYAPRTMARPSVLFSSVSTWLPLSPLRLTRRNSSVSARTRFMCYIHVSIWYSWEAC